MDQRERAGDLTEALRMALDGRQTTIWTALPGIVQSFDATKMTCVVQPAIQGRVTDKKGVASFVNLPLLLDCPVQFMGGGGVTLTFPITKGDECLVVFTSRCLDGWWQLGGIQPPLEARMHDLSDGFALVGVRSQPRKLSPAVDTTKTQLRSDDGVTFIELDPAGGLVKVKATTVTIQGDLVVSGKADINGASLKHQSVNVGKDHKHSGVQAGGSNTGNPI